MTGSPKKLTLGGVCLKIDEKDEPRQRTREAATGRYGFPAAGKWSGENKNNWRQLQ
jgi:hypothetical protein